MDQPETIALPMQGTPFNGMDIARELLRVFTLVPPEQCVAIISDNCVVPKNAIRFVTAHMPARGLRSLSKTQRTLLRACQSAGINQLTCGMHTLNLFVEKIFKAFPRALVCIQRVHAAYNGEHSIKHRKALVRDLSLNPNLLRICKVRWTSRTEVIQYVCTHREALIQHLVEKVRTSTATKAAEVLCDARYCIELNAARLMTEHLCKLIARMQGSDALTGDIAALLDVAVRNDATSHAFHRLIADSMDRADDIDTQVTEPSALERLKVAAFKRRKRITLENAVLSALDNCANRNFGGSVATWQVRFALEPDSFETTLSAAPRLDNSTTRSTRANATTTQAIIRLQMKQA